MKVIRDKDNNIIGYIDTLVNGDKQIRTPDQKILGTYVKEKGVTINSKHVVIGYGNLLESLLNKKD